MANQFGYGKIVTDGLMLYYNVADSNCFNINNTGSLNDLSGHGKHGTLINNVLYDSNNGGSLIFDGTSSYVQFSNPLNQSQLEQEWTVQSWINIYSKPPQYLINGLNNNLLIEAWQGNNSILYLNSGVNDYYTYGGQFTNQGWVLSTFRFNNSNGNRQILRNTTNISTSGPNKTSTPSGQSSTFTIGYSNTSTILGKISNLLIYNRYLTDYEIQQNFNTQRSRFNI